MAKQISISDEAYKILIARKGEQDSFSKVILKAFKEQGNVKEIIERVKKNPLNKSYLIDKKLLDKGWEQWRTSTIK